MEGVVLALFWRRCPCELDCFCIYIVISIFLTSIRPQNWDKVYTSISEATTRPFEVVVTSPNDQVPTMPDNFRVVYTKVKPAQALEAACRSCRGELIVESRDDLTYDPGALDAMAEIVSNNEHTIASARYFVGNRDEHVFHELGAVGYTGGLMPMCGMMRAEDWAGAGGSDPCFCSFCGADDLIMRLLVSGWKTVLVKQRVLEVSEGSDLFWSSGIRDLELMRGLWCKDGVFTGQRTVPPGHYTDEVILTENQGTVRGSQATRWK
jgi:hypothetical protein